jgi:hypothetical protein
VLVHALLDAANPGSRLRALKYAGEAEDPKLREALIFALRRDSSLAVRMRALTVLSGHLDQPEVEGALFDALRDDPAVAVRLLALDSLAAGRVDRARIRALLEERAAPSDEALLVRLAAFEERL